MEKLNRQATASSFTVADFKLILSYGADESAAVNEMLTLAKKNYVLNHHPRRITQMNNASGYKKGKWKTYVYADEKRKEILGDTEEDIYNKLYYFYSSLESSNMTLEQVFELRCTYKRECLNRSQNTINEDKAHFSQISEKLKNMPLSKIDEEELRKWIVSDFLTIKPRISRFKKTLQLLDQIFDYGIRKKYCVENPMTYISANEYLHHCDNTQKADEEKAFSEDEIKRIIEDAKDKLDNPRVLMSLLASETGLRVGELCALHKEDIGEDYIHVHRQQIREEDTDPDHNVRQKFYEVQYTKDEKSHPHDGRYVPLTAYAKEVIKYANSIKGESIYLFHDKGKEAMVTTSSYSHNLSKRCKKLGCIPTNNHAFRMAFNSRLIGLGFSAADRALILGHEVQTNEAHYSLTDKRRLEDIKNRMV